MKHWLHVPSLSAAAAGTAGLTFLILAAPVAVADDLRVGIVGLDTSHVPAFLELFNSPTSPDHVPGVKIVAGFKGGSPDVEASRSRVENFTRQAVEKYGIKLYDSVEQLALNVDAIMILSVDGRPHLDQFRRTLAARKPVFIDKPLAGSLADCLEIVRLSRERHVPCFSSSSLRYTLDSPARRMSELGQLTAAFSWGPIEIEPHHPDLFWYGIHSVEALYSVLGPGCIRVARTSTENTELVTGVWSDGRVGTMQGNHQQRAYGVVAVGTHGVLTGGTKHSYRPMAEAIVSFFRSGIAPVDLDTTVEIYAFMEAADESKRRNGMPVSLAEVMAHARAATPSAGP